MHADKYPNYKGVFLLDHGTAFDRRGISGKTGFELSFVVLLMVAEELKRFDRTLAILVLLQSRKLIKAQQLSERFGVSLRTIYRDIRSLEAAGVPVIGEAGQGYSIMDGYRLPPVMFTREEAGSFVAAEKLMQKFSDAGLGRYFESAMNKIKSVLKGQQKDWIAALENKVWAAPGHDLFHKEIPNALELLFESIAAQKQAFLKYQSLGSEAASSRFIEPVGVFHENAHWYLYAFCHLRSAYRQFRTDRILAIHRTDKDFTKAHGKLSDYKQEQRDFPKAKVVIAVSKEAVRYLGDSKKYYGFIKEETKGNEVVMEFLTCSTLEGLARWYLMFGDQARVLEPESFRQKIKELAEKTQKNLLS